MTKLIALVKASLLRERQWADTQFDRHLRFDELVYDAQPGGARRDDPATVPMPLPRSR